MKLEEDHKAGNKIEDSKQQCLATTSQLNGSEHNMIHKMEENVTMSNHVDLPGPLKFEYKSDASLLGPHQCSPLSKPCKGIVIKPYYDIIYSKIKVLR